MSDIGEADVSAAAASDGPFVSFAQNFEDVMLWRALGARVTQGFYIDVGAAEPDADSVTRAFYDRGWHGINIEPNPKPHGRLQHARPRDTTLQLAVGDHEGEVEFHVVGDENGLSTLVPDLAAQHRDAGWSTSSTRTTLTTLAAICARHVDGPIHFLKLDVEGAELEVLRGADFTRWRPWIILIETPAPDSFLPQPGRWEEILHPAGYSFVYFDGLNRFYVSGEHAELADAFRTPPNIFDRFVHVAQIEKQRQLEQARRTIEEMQAHMDHARDEACLTQDGDRALIVRLTAERDAWMQELFETNRHAAHLTQARQTILDDNRRLQLEHRSFSDRLDGLQAEYDRLADEAGRLRVQAQEAELRDAVAREAGETMLRRNETLQRESRSFSDRLNGLQAEYDRLAEEAQLLRTQTRETEQTATGHVRRLELENRSLSGRLDGLQADYDRLAEEAGRTRRHVRAMYDSTSWKVSRPARMLARILKR